MPFASSADLLVLHGLRVAGMADAGTVARRSHLDRAEVDELLLDFEAYGWVRRVEFADTRGWSLTETGRVEDEQAARGRAGGLRRP